jgi:hypothetical protein
VEPTVVSPLEEVVPSIEQSESMAMVAADGMPRIGLEALALLPVIAGCVS